VPIYEFECAECGNRFEEMTSVGTEDAGCPECGSAGAKRRFSVFGVTTRQMTTYQKRRAEDVRGTDRGGARERFQKGLDRARGEDSAAKRKRGGS
jgi:putative FmdB family regulatory protein